LGADWPSAAKSDKKDRHQPEWPAELYHLRDVTDQVDMAQIPKSRAHVKALEMIVSGGNLKTDTLQTECAVEAALGPIHFSREGYFEFGTVTAST